MSGQQFVDMVVESDVDAAAARKILASCQLSVAREFGKHGKEWVLKNASRYSLAAEVSPYFLLVDQDDDACAPSTLKKAGSVRSRLLVFRVATRSIESWLMADAEALADFLAVSPAHIPPDTDAITDPKAVLVGIASISRRRAIREGMVPRAESGRKVGAAYETMLIEFCAKHYDPMRAAQIGRAHV